MGWQSEDCGNTGEQGGQGDKDVKIVIMCRHGNKQPLYGQVAWILEA